MIHKTQTFNGEFNQVCNNGIISFTQEKNTIPLKELFDVKVGAVSGADKYFEYDRGESFVCSQTCKNERVKKMIYHTFDKNLLKYKPQLIQRKMKAFNENNWWEWGRPVNFYENRERIYVNTKTRNKQPFFYHECKKWDGSVLALFPNFKIKSIDKLLISLNNLDWENFGFIIGGRAIFSQKSLSEVPICKELLIC